MARTDSRAAVPEVPTPLLTVVAIERPAEPSERVVTLDADGCRSELDAAPELDPVLIEHLRATGKAGEVHPLPGRRWLLGVGDREAAACRTAGAALARALNVRADRASGINRPPPEKPSLDSPPPEKPSPDKPSPEPALLAVGVGGWSESSRAALVTGLLLGSHRFRVSRAPRPTLGLVELVAPEPELAELRATVEVAGEVAGATALARDLASTPSDVKTPTWLVRTAAELAADVPGLTATVWPVERLAAEGFGGLLAVGRGSSRPPALLRLDWAPEHADGPHVVLVGKGVTFDTGGISIKPADGMHLMRTDMSGGAAVIGAMLAIGRLGVPVRVTGLVPAAENHVSGSAYRPGDVVRHYDGTTTEVVNTDAEGRMVLADAMGYAVRELAPDLMVDVATLTGSMKVALGLRTGGMFASEDWLAALVLAAGELAGERWWRMPLLEHVAEDVRSDIADLRQAPPGPGGISAALFLREFTGGLPWAHLDIAGPARCEKPYAEMSAGATGFAARTLIELVRGYAIS